MSDPKENNDDGNQKPIQVEMNTLLTDERLDLSLSTESFPGISKYSQEKEINYKIEQQREIWNSMLDHDDLKMIWKLSKMTKCQLLLRVKDFNDFAYILGLEETKEMNRGKLLNILKKNKKIRKPKKNSEDI